MRSTEQVDRVRELAARGLNASQVARETGIPRGTVRGWLAGRLPRSSSPGRNCPAGCDLRELAGAFPESYAYMLGMYLGDGYISSHPKSVYRLRIALDLRYPEIIFECAARLRIVCGYRNEVSQSPMSKGRGVAVGACSRHWPCLFPQHGRGKRHERPIVLEAWQRSIIELEPESFLRGLIHSDGCRNLNNRGSGSAWQGVRYLFRNRSEDILGLFCETCDRLALHWTRPSCDTISVARAPDTARLDRFIGPKQ